MRRSSKAAVLVPAIVSAVAVTMQSSKTYATPSLTQSLVAGQYSTTSTFASGTFTAITFTGANQTISIPMGDYFRFGVADVFSGVADPEAGGAYSTAATTAYGVPAYPSNLGVAGIGYTVVSSDAAGTTLTPVVGTTNSLGSFSKAVQYKGVANSGFSSQSPGQITAGEVGINGAGVITNSIFIGNGSPTTAQEEGGNNGSAISALSDFTTLSNAFTGLMYKASAAGSITLTPTLSPVQISYYTESNTHGTTTGAGAPGTDPVFNANVLPLTDVNNLGILPTLTISIAGTGGTSGTNKIASLFSSNASLGGTAPNGYNSSIGSASLGTLTVSGSNGKYYPGFIYFNGSGSSPIPQTTGYIMLAGFNPGSDQPLIALALDDNGVPLAQGDSRLAAIIADISGSENNVSSGVVTVASLNSSNHSLYLALGGGAGPFDVLLTATSGGGVSPYFAFDFSSSTDTDTATGAITVAAIAAVPEPATAAAVVLGAAGLLLGRRRKLAEVA